MNFTRFKLKTRREIKIARTKAGLGAKSISKKTRKQAKKIKKNLPKLQKKARKRGMDIEMYFRKQLNPKISIY